MIIESWGDKQEGTAYLMITKYYDSQDNYERWKLLTELVSLHINPKDLPELIGVHQRDVYASEPEFIIDIVDGYNKVEIISNNKTIINLCFNYIMRNVDINLSLLKKNHAECFV